MTCNVGGVDRILRIVLGVLILAMGAYYQSLWALVGLIPLGTGLVRFCPLYMPIKFSSAKDCSGES